MAAKPDVPISDGGRRARLKSAFNAALSLQPEHRSRYLAVLRAGSASFAQEVSRYLRHFREAGDFLEPQQPPSRPVTFKAHDLVAERFRIVRLLGQGGMGEVYEAIDLVLEQPIALKTIRSDFAADAATRSRFLSELQLARKVAHPNVCRTHELWQVDRSGQEPLVFLTMELLEGETLAALLQREGRLSPAAALPLMEQLVAALDAIHGLKIIHRDLKPSNVHIVPGGGTGPRVVVTDFGLARLTVGDATLTTGLAGTPAYMAPEQFDRGDCSVASDVYAFGVICFEMLTGQRQPIVPPRSINPALDQRWEDFILRCVAQDPKKRPASAKVLLSEFQRLRSYTRARAWRPAMLASAAMVGLSVAVLAATMWGRNAPDEQAEFTRITFDSGMSWDPSATPDGSRIVYSSDRGPGEGFQIWQQQMRTPTAAAGDGATTGDDPVQLTHIPGHAVSPAISPDGRLVAYRSEAANGGVDVVSIDGGQSRRLGPYGRHPRFSPDGTQIVYWTGVEGDHALPSGRLWIVGVNGGTPRQLQPTMVDARFPAWSPDGKWILFRGSTTRGPRWDAMSDWFVTDPQGRTLAATGAYAAFASTRVTLHDGAVTWLPHQVMFAARAGHSTNLWSIAISDDTGLIAGRPERLTSGSNLETSPWQMGSGFIAYTNWVASAQIWRTWTTGPKAGQPEAMTLSDALDTRPSVSVDGQLLIFTRRVGEARNLWFKDLASGKETSLVAGTPLVPALSADGRSIAYSMNEGAKRPIVIMPASGGATRMVCQDCGELQGWSADGTLLIYVRQAPDGRRTLETVEIATGRTHVLVIDETISEGSLSPDGRDVAFSVRRDGVESRIYLASARGTGPTARAGWRPITPAGGWADKPRWAMDGRTMFYYTTRDGFGCIWRQPFTLEGAPVGEPSVVQHVHDGRHAILHLSRQAFSMSVAPDYVAYNKVDAGGNIWMMNPPPPAGRLTQFLGWLTSRAP